MDTNDRSSTKPITATNYGKNYTDSFFAVIQGQPKKTFINVINSFLTFLLEFYQRCYYLLVFVIIILMKMLILFT